MSINEAEVTIIAQQTAQMITRECREREKEYLDDKFKDLSSTLQEALKGINNKHDETKKNVKEINEKMQTFRDFQVKTEERLELGYNRMNNIEKTAKSAHKRINFTTKISAIILGAVSLTYTLVQFYEFLKSAR